MRKYCDFYDIRKLSCEWDNTFMGMNPLPYYISCGGYNSPHLFINQYLFKDDLNRILPPDYISTSTEDDVSHMFGDEGLRLYYLLTE